MGGTGRQCSRARLLFRVLDLMRNLLEKKTSACCRH